MHIRHIRHELEWGRLVPSVGKRQNTTIGSNRVPIPILADLSVVGEGWNNFSIRNSFGFALSSKNL
jgi:hypothetical protein